MTGFPPGADPDRQRLRAGQRAAKDMKQGLSGTDLQEGLTAVVSIKHP